MTEQAPIYSFIFPVKDEEAVVPELGRQVRTFLNELDGPAEVLIIDDGSSDRSLQRMKELQAQDERFRIIELSRNFGHQVAITAGMDHARGQAIIIMDADLQDPFYVVHEMIAEWRNGAEVVYAVRRAREGETAFKKATAAIFYRIYDRLTDVKMPLDTGDFRLVSRNALDAFLTMREHHRFVRGMFAWVGFRQKGVQYQREKRFAGETKYPLRKMIRLALDGLVGFSDAPLRMVLNLGTVISILSLVMGLVFIILKFTGAYAVAGWTSLAVLVTFLGGINLLVLGIIGLYIGRIYEGVKNRPLYVVKELHQGNSSRET